MNDDRDEAILRNAFMAEPSTNAERRALARLRNSIDGRDFASPRPWRARRLAFSTLAVAISAGVTVAAIVALRLNHPQPSKSPAGVPSATAQPTLTAPPSPTALPTPTVAAGPAVACAPTIGQLRMTSANDGWAVCQDAAQHSRIVTTGDGGRTFHDVSPEPMRPSSFQGGATIAAATAAGHAWASVFDASGSASGLYRTADGGATWARSTPGPSAPSGGIQISVTSASVAYAYVEAGGAAGSMSVEVWRSQDGGVSWTQVSATNPSGSGATGVPSACIKNGFGWRDDSTGWVTGTCYGGQPAFYVTHDGGVHWTNQALPLAPGADPGGGGFTTNPPVFSTPRDGIMIANGQIGSGPTAFVYTTHDGGVSWAYTQAPANTRQVAVGGGAEIAILGDGTLCRSPDGGGQWLGVAQHPELNATTLASAQFVDPDHGFFVVSSSSGAQTSLYVTSDGGRTLVRRQG